MPRLPLILCALAVLVLALTAGFSLRLGESKKSVDLRLADQTARTAQVEAALAAAHELSGSLKANVAGLTAELETSRGKLTAIETRAAGLERDLSQAKTVLAVYDDTARALADEVAALRTDLSEARASNAAPEAVEGYKNTIAELERQLANARNGAALPTAAGAANAVFASRVGRATVLTVGPESSFVVLNFGAVRGAQVGQKLSVSQGTEVVATVLINDVRNNFSIAHVLPDSLRGVLHKGDSAVLLR